MIRRRRCSGLLYCLVSISACLALAGCAAPVSGTSEVRRPGAGAVGVACTLPTNCVSSLGEGRFAPIRFDRSPAEAIAALRATLADFPEARIADAGPSSLVAIFRTPAGFEDEVVFQVDDVGKRIDYRSRSLVGLFDFGKNGSRMEAFLERLKTRLPR